MSAINAYINYGTKTVDNFTNALYFVMFRLLNSRKYFLMQKPAYFFLLNNQKSNFLKPNLEFYAWV